MAYSRAAQQYLAGRKRRRIRRGTQAKHRRRHLVGRARARAAARRKASAEASAKW